MTKDSEEKGLKDLIDELRIELTGYVRKRLRLFKLDAFDKGGRVLSAIGYGLIVLIISFAISFFFLFGLGFFLGEILNSNAAGFGILLAFCVLVLIIVILNRKKIKRIILLKSLDLMRKIDANEED